MAGHPHPKRKLIRRLLVHGICPFEDEMKPPSALLAERTFLRTLVQGVLIQLLCLFEDGTRAARRRAIAQTALR